MWTDEWTSGWMDGRTNGWTDRWMDGQTYGLTDGQTNWLMDGPMDGWMDRWMGDRPTDGRQTDGWTTGQTDGQTYKVATSCSPFRKHKNDMYTKCIAYITRKWNFSLKIYHIIYCFIACILVKHVHPIIKLLFKKILLLATSEPEPTSLTPRQATMSPAIDGARNSRFTRSLPNLHTYSIANNKHIRSVWPKTFLYIIYGQTC